MLKDVVSIIVPVYNAEKYLERCIESILSQSYRNLEILLIDDGSTDNSLIICKEYSLKDKRIHVFHKKNGGASSARNFGINKANGNWICFVDSDDYVLENYIYNMVKNVPKNRDENNFLIVSSLSTKNGKLMIEEEIVLNNSIPIAAINKKMIFAPYCKLFNREIILQNKIEFPVGITNGEDFVFTCKYMKFINRVIFLNNHDYVYITQPGSLSLRKTTFSEEFKNYNAMRIAWEELMDVFKCNDKNTLLWNSGVYIRFSYLLRSLFYNKELTISTILYNIKCINKDINEFSHYAPLEGKRTFISRFLLRKGYYYGFIIYNKILLKLGKSAVA